MTEQEELEVLPRLQLFLFYMNICVRVTCG